MAGRIDFDDLIDAAITISAWDSHIFRRVVMWGADCAAHVVGIFEKVYPFDPRPRKAIIATRATMRSGRKSGLRRLSRAHCDAERATVDAEAEAQGWSNGKLIRPPKASEPDTLAALEASWSATWTARAALERPGDRWIVTAADFALDAAESYAPGSAAATHAWQDKRLNEWLSQRAPEPWPLPVLPST